MDDFFWEHLEALIGSRSRKVEGSVGVDLDCIDWTGALSKKGYGFIHLILPNKTKVHTTVHRAAYMLAKKIINIPDQMEISHLCHRPSCINAGHLILESKITNSERKMCHKSGMCLGHWPTCMLEVDLH